MSYDICLKAKIGKSAKFVIMDSFNITYNIRQILVKSSGYEKWSGNFEVSAKEIYLYFAKGLEELLENGEKYRQYEPSNGWGSVENVIEMYRWFFDILNGLSVEDLNDVYLEVY